MEDRKEPDLGSQMFGIGGYLQKGFRTGAEQEVIEDLLVLQRQWGELVRQSKDNVDIGDRQKFVLTSRDPLIASPALTLGAVSIAATFFLSLRERLTPSRPETSRVSSGLGTACRCLCERCR